MFSWSIWSRISQSNPRVYGVGEESTPGVYGVGEECTPGEDKKEKNKMMMMLLVYK